MLGTLGQSGARAAPAAGEALLDATSRHGFEGIVAKRRRDPYRPGERGWVKVKHRHYWRFGQELELAQRSRRSVARII
jgi:ATP-dependent DNA ligase